MKRLLIAIVLVLATLAVAHAECDGPQLSFNPAVSPFGEIQTVQEYELHIDFSAVRECYDEQLERSPMAEEDGDIDVLYSVDYDYLGDNSIPGEQEISGYWYGVEQVIPIRIEYPRLHLAEGQQITDVQVRVDITFQTRMIGDDQTYTSYESFLVCNEEDCTPEVEPTTHCQDAGRTVGTACSACLAGATWQETQTACACTGGSNVCGEQYCSIDTSTPDGYVCLDATQTATNVDAIAHNGKLYLCGKHWDVSGPDENKYVKKGLCGVVNTYTNSAGYICSISTEGWTWLAQGELETLSKYNSTGGITPEWQALAQTTPNGVLENGLLLDDVDFLSCIDGAVTESEMKWDPLRTSKGPTPVTHCWDGTQPVTQGTLFGEGRFTCTQNQAGEGYWVSRVSELAQVLVSEARSDAWIINCGDDLVTINADDDGVGQNLRSEWGYCQLAVLDGAQVRTIVMGVAFKPSIETRANTREEYLEQLELLNENDNLYADQQSFEVASNQNRHVDWNSSARILRFSHNKDRSLVETIIDWFTSLFGGDDAPAPTIDTAAEQFFVAGQGSQVTAFVVKAQAPEENNQLPQVDGTLCATNFVIEVNGQITACYTDAQWREEVQTR